MLGQSFLYCPPEAGAGNEAGFPGFLPCVLLQQLGLMTMQEPLGADMLCGRLTFLLLPFIFSLCPSNMESELFQFPLVLLTPL